MPRPALATLVDLEAWLGESVPNDAHATALLAHASEIVRAYAGVSWLDEDPPAQIPGVVCAMVERATRNPAGVVQETAGPFTRSFGRDAAQRLYLTRAERAVIRAAVGRLAVLPLATTRGPIETAGRHRHAMVVARGGG
ncbi:MAG: hypothetical protein M5U14_22220 [Acidimicrobiia bacterium]|nr:hypothetical protein [Acidimicrobiia bacterium]